jgi:hypothetical protein
MSEHVGACQNMSPFEERKGAFFYHSLPVMFHCLCEKRYFPNISNSQNNWRIRKRHISGSEEKKREREREMKREIFPTADSRPPTVVRNDHFSDHCQ